MNFFFMNSWYIRSNFMFLDDIEITVFREHSPGALLAIPRFADARYHHPRSSVSPCTDAEGRGGRWERAAFRGGYHCRCREIGRKMGNPAAWWQMVDHRGGERERESRSLRLPRITRETTRDGANTPRSLGRNAKLYGCETWDGDVRGCRAGCGPGNFKSCTTLCLLRKMITSVSILSVSYGLLTKIHAMNSNFMRIYTYE